MESPKLKRDAITQPQLWRMVMEIGKQTLTVALFPPTKTESPITETLTLDTPEKPLVKALESVIYDNALLLSEFKRIDCLIDTEKFLYVPSTDDEETINLYFNRVFPDAEEVETSKFSNGEMMIYEAEGELQSFLKRTFFGIKITHRLSPLIKYLQNSAKGDEYIVLNENNKGFDIAAFRNGTLLTASSYGIASETDEVYYLYALKEAFSIIDPKIYLRSSKNRGELSESILHTYFPSIRPWMTAYDLLQSGKAYSEIPLTMLATTLCE
ncbi:MAG: DUF3822 family protein [Paramuribaculum sp.]|nr:DUF3822 family protein [Paramuribaculum sp.]